MKKFPLVWVIFHSIILLAFLISLAVSPKIRFATSLFEILPPSSSLHEVQQADTNLGSKTGRAVTILVRGPSFQKAKSAAEKLYLNYVTDSGAGFIPDSRYFDRLSLYVDSESVAQMRDWLHKNRFVLLSKEDQEALNSGNAGQLAERAVMSAYGAFTLSDLSSLEEDPFLLSEESLKNLLGGGALSSTNMTLKDQLLYCQKDGDFFVLIRGRISEKGAALASKKSTVHSLLEKMEEVKKEFPSERDEGASEIDFIYSGVPFHSYESSTSAQAQISVISTISLVLIVVIFLLIFRSLIPALLSALAVAFSCGMGFLSTLLFFRGIHVLTFVFGTTLIGTCLDYSIHYFVNWKYNAACKTGEEVRKHIFKGISLGFISTEICFAALFLAPFPLLKQVSVFLFTGLATAYLSVVSLYPLLPMAKKKGKKLLFEKISLPGKVRFVPLFLGIFSLTVIFTNYRSFKIHNNIQELYSMSPKMLENEINSAKILNTGSSGWYFILKADSEEELLQKNEELESFLTKSVNENKLGSYLSVTSFIPSEKTQTESYKAAENLLPLVKDQYKNLALAENDEMAKNLNDNYENNYRSLLHRFIHVEDPEVPVMIREGIENLWVGEVDGSYYSSVMPLHAKAEEEEFFREYAAENEGVYFVNKVKDISAQLDLLSKSMLLMLALAFILVIGILFFFYKAKLVLKVAAIPVTVTLVTCAVLLLCNVHLSFFPITALVLVFGLGLDYIIYAIEGSDNSFAILLSFVTTALSFGALALSNFPPVHMLGLTVFAGLTSALISSFTITAKRD